MPVDNCVHTFEQLASTVLPAHLARLQGALCSAVPTGKLVGFKSATKEVLAKLGRTADLPGCYVFSDKTGPVYVGISRNVVKRVVQHLNFESHFMANLVYKMAAKDNLHKMTRDQAMKDDEFKRKFLTAQNSLRQTTVAFIEISNDLELYLFEAYAAMQLNTYIWNTFRTH